MLYAAANDLLLCLQTTAIMLLIIFVFFSASLFLSAKREKFVRDQNKFNFSMSYCDKNVSPPCSFPLIEELVSFLGEFNKESPLHF